MNAYVRKGRESGSNEKELLKDSNGRVETCPARHMGPKNYRVGASPGCRQRAGEVGSEM